METMNKSTTILHFTNVIIYTFILQSFSFGIEHDHKKVNLLFYEVDQVLRNARKEKADILVPKEFEKAMKNLQKTESDYNKGKGKNLPAIRKQLQAIVSGLQKVINQSKVVRFSFGHTLQARFDAEKSEAPSFASDLWQQAENRFKEACRIFEDGNTTEAKKKSIEAEQIYRKAELDAIRLNYLNEAYTFLKEAENKNVKIYAPKTLKKAQDFIEDAERELAENLYDTDAARVMAREAKREAKHAHYLASVIKKIKEKKLTSEDILLSSEAPLKKIAKTLNVDISYEAGFSKSTDEIIKLITEYKNENTELKTGIFDASKLVNLLQARIEELEANMGGVKTEKSSLSQVMERYEKLGEKYTYIKSLFDSDGEAVIIREGNDLRIRLTGLSFFSGKSKIDPKYYSFLNKVLKTIGIFPNSTITIEGHTDSFGSDAQNLQLSYDRAENVMIYILDNIDIEESRIKAIGYGETSPIATNETEEGRTMNRRIAVVIHPKLD